MHMSVLPLARHVPKARIREHAGFIASRRWYLAPVALLAACAIASALSVGSSAPIDRRNTPYCALVLPPSQVARRVELDVVYCKGLSAENQCQADFGWIVVSEPVTCD